MGEIPDRSVKGDKNLAKLHRKAMTKFVYQGFGIWCLPRLWCVPNTAVACVCVSEGISVSLMIVQFLDKTHWGTSKTNELYSQSVLEWHNEAKLGKSSDLTGRRCLFSLCTFFPRRGNY